MQAFIVIDGSSFHTTKDSAEECLSDFERQVAESLHRLYTFTFQPSTGYIYANPGSSHIPCGVLYRRQAYMDL